MALKTALEHLTELDEAMKRTRQALQAGRGNKTTLRSNLAQLRADYKYWREIYDREQAGDVSIWNNASF